MNKEQITSLIRALAIMLVSIAGMFGLVIDEETSQVFVIGVAMLVLIAYGLWKNHNLTGAAALAQQVLDLLKQHILTFEAVEELIDAANNGRLAEYETKLNEETQMPESEESEEEHQH